MFTSRAESMEAIRDRAMMLEGTAKLLRQSAESMTVLGRDSILSTPAGQVHFEALLERVKVDYMELSAILTELFTAINE